MSGLNSDTVLPFQCIVSAAVHVIQPQYPLHASNAGVTYNQRCFAGLYFCFSLPFNGRFQISVHRRKMLKTFIATEYLYEPINIYFYFYSVMWGFCVLWYHLHQNRGPCQVISRAVFLKIDWRQILVFLYSRQSLFHCVIKLQ